MPGCPGLLLAREHPSTEERQPLGASKLYTYCVRFSLLSCPSFGLEVRLGEQRCPLLGSVTVPDRQRPVRCDPSEESDRARRGGGMDGNRSKKGLSVTYGQWSVGSGAPGPAHSALAVPQVMPLTG